MLNRTFLWRNATVDVPASLLTATAEYHKFRTRSTDYRLDRIPVGTRFSARPDRPWGPPSHLYNGYRVFPEGRNGRCVGLTPIHIWCRGPRNSRAIPLLTLRACVVYKKGWKLPIELANNELCVFNFLRKIITVWNNRTNRLFFLIFIAEKLDIVIFPVAREWMGETLYFYKKSLMPT